MSVPALANKKSNFNAVEYLDNYDGDTISFNIRGVPSIIGDNMPVRVLGVDTPELRTSNKCERELAYKVKEFVAETLRKSKMVRLENCERGKYFRLVCDVYYDRAKSLAPELLKRGYAVEYWGGTKPTVDWCKKG